MTNVRIDDSADVLRRIRGVGVLRQDVRAEVQQLALQLARRTRGVLHAHDTDDTVLCVIILRGGALLYGGFAAAFRSADFCMMAMERTAGGIVCPYATTIPRRSYSAVVYVDCVAATGATVEAARRQVRRRYARAGAEYAAVLCSSGHATGVMERAGLTVVGFDLDEGLDGDLVVPDLGHLDAGDVFTSA